MGVRRDKTVLVGACDPRCGTCATLAGGGLVGGTGGTGSFAAHTGGQISNHGKSSLCRRFAISGMVRGTGRSHNCAATRGVIRPDRVGRARQASLAARLRSAGQPPASSFPQPTSVMPSGPEPHQCRRTLGERIVPHLHADDMIGHELRDRRERRVGDQCDAPHTAW